MTTITSALLVFVRPRRHGLVIRHIESAPMRRWLVVFLLLVLPFQFTWAAAAPYCAHETAAAASKHPGHHQHVHHDGSDAMNAGDEGDSTGVKHTDCASCHAGSAATLPLSSTALAAAPRDGVCGHSPPRYRSHTPRGPERPDIVELTPAARLGGGVVGDASNLA